MIRYRYLLFTRTTGKGNFNKKKSFLLWKVKIINKYFIINTGTGTDSLQNTSGWIYGAGAACFFFFFCFTIKQKCDLVYKTKSSSITFFQTCFNSYRFCFFTFQLEIRSRIRSWWRPKRLALALAPAEELGFAFTPFRLCNTGPGTVF